MSFTSNTILVALELSNSLWLVGTRMPGAQKSRMHRISAGDTATLLALFDGLRSRQPTMSGHLASIACCFEAGRDGFWLHRLLTANGIPTYVVEPTSILVNRRAKRAKTDRIDAEGLLRVLATYLAGDSQICSMIRVPTPDEEDGKGRRNPGQKRFFETPSGRADQALRCRLAWRLNFAGPAPAVDRLNRRLQRRAGRTNLRFKPAPKRREVVRFKGADPKKAQDFSAVTLAVAT